MSDEIRPNIIDKIGYCTEDCPSFDGKRCMLVGFVPSDICEPWIKKLVIDHENILKYVGDDTPYQSEDYTRGQERAWDNIIFHLDLWLTKEKSRSTGVFSDPELQRLYHLIWDLRQIREMWSIGCDKLQSVIQRYNIGKCGDDIFDIAVQHIEQAHACSGIKNV